MLPCFGFSGRSRKAFPSFRVRAATRIDIVSRPSRVATRIIGGCNQGVTNDLLGDLRAVKAHLLNADALYVRIRPRRAGTCDR